MKKKVFFILVIFSAVLLIGATVSFLGSTFDASEEYSVVIKYATVNADGETEVFKTYSASYLEGETIRVKSPDLYGYVADKNEIAAIANNDYYITVRYICQHVDTSEADIRYTDTSHYEFKTCNSCYAELIDNVTIHTLYDYQVLEYPNSEKVGTIIRKCEHCNYEITEEFTTLTKTLVFGGDIVNEFSGYSAPKTIGNYHLAEKQFVLLKPGATEWDLIFDGVNIDNTLGIGDGATVTIEYDKSVWGESTIEFKQSSNENIDSDYSVRIANNWRVIFGFETRDDGDIASFIQDENCPLKLAPLTITVTYDYTNK